MARLTWTGWLGVVGLCLMLTLAVLPKTKWLMKLHGYVAMGQLKVDRNPFGYSVDARESTIDVYELLRLLQPDMPAGLKKDLVGAILTKTEEDGDNRRDKMAEIAAKYPENALVQAAACRYFSMAVIPRPDTAGNLNQPRRTPEDLAKRQRLYSQLVEIANRGIAADPENLYFDLILSCAKCGQQKVDEAREIIRKATKKQTYNEYSWDECNLLTDMMKGSNDCGAYLRLQVYASLVLPYYANMKSMSIWLVQTGTEEQRKQSSIDLLIVANTVSSKVDIIIGILVMRAITSIALVGTAPHEQGEKPTKEAYLAAIEKLQPLADARFPKVSIPELRTIYDQSSRLAQAIKEYSDENDRKVMSNDPSAYPLSPFAKMRLSLGFLLAVVFLIPAALMQIAGQKLRAHPRPLNALPLLVPLFVGFYMTKFNYDPAELEYGWIAGISWWTLLAAFILSWEPKLAKASFWITIAVGAAGVLFSIYSLILDYSPFSVPFFLSISALISAFASLDKGPQWLRSVVSATVVFAAAAAASLNLALSHVNGTEWIVALTIVMLAACIGPVRPNAGRRIVGPSILAASVVFALLCRQMVAIDQQADLMTKTFKSEVSKVRQMAQTQSR